MSGKVVDLIEDLEKGITLEQLAPRPVKEGKKDEQDSGRENA